MPLSGNRAVNASIGRIANGIENKDKGTSPIAGSKGLLGALGQIVATLFGTNLAAGIGNVTLPYLGTPSGPASGGQAAPQASQAAEANKAKEARGTTVNVEDPKEKLFNALRAAGHDVQKSGITDEMVRDYNNGKMLAQIANKIPRSAAPAAAAPPTAPATAAAPPAPAAATPAAGGGSSHDLENPARPVVYTT